MATTVYGKQSNLKVKKDTQVIDQKVYGLNYPLGVNRGHFSKQTGTVLVRNMLKQLLQTERGERVMLPNFGCDTKKFMFEQLDDITFNELKTEILTSIHQYLPFVEVLKLSVVNKDEVNYEGVPGLVVTLDVLIKEPDPQFIEIKVEIG